MRQGNDVTLVVSFETHTTCYESDDYNPGHSTDFDKTSDALFPVLGVLGAKCLSARLWSLTVEP
ncbi:hypothetical protein DPMN_100882 [Dreissena polymorpha]|uniref:Uncharacterized protein n=1 Tax=Dreissena polymorpha TaxID=45954 RepID=A0A9D4LHW2_DREPO|nr:hypothetical protein DPMN_100882 [Dreissena polymorpha]